MLTVCPYCNNPAEIVQGDKIYPHRKDLYSKNFYLCAPCGAYVGCHGRTTQPLGRLADRALRSAKSAAHRAFDPIWKSGELNRGQAYKWLAERMELPSERCHIGMFDVSQCKRVVELCGENNA